MRRSAPSRSGSVPRGSEASTGGRSAVRTGAGRWARTPRRPRGRPSTDPPDEPPSLHVDASCLVQMPGPPFFALRAGSVLFAALVRATPHEVPMHLLELRLAQWHEVG